MSVVNISQPLQEICDLLGLHDYHAIAELTIRADGLASAVVYLRNENGDKFTELVDPATATYMPAREVRAWAIKT